MAPITIGDLSFKTKKSACEYVRTRLNDIGCCEILPSSPHFDFMCDLLVPSEMFDTNAVSKFTITINQLSPKGKHVLFTRADGTVGTFSWRYACGIKPSIYSLQSQACRTAVMSRMSEIRTGNVCELCGSINNLHAHHSGNSFKEIVDTFIKRNDMPCRFDINVEYGVRSFKPIDDAVRLAFIQHHDGMAHIQVLCHGCHKKVHEHCSDIQSSLRVSP